MPIKRLPPYPEVESIGATNPHRFVWKEQVDMEDAVYGSKYRREHLFRSMIEGFEYQSIYYLKEINSRFSRYAETFFRDGVPAEKLLRTYEKEAAFWYEDQPTMEEQCAVDTIRFGSEIKSVIEADAEGYDQMDMFFLASLFFTNAFSAYEFDTTSIADQLQHHRAKADKASQRYRKGGANYRNKTLAAREIAVDHAGQVWSQSPSIPIGAVCGQIEDRINLCQGRRLSLRTIKKYLKDAEKRGELVIPLAALQFRPGRPKKPAQS